MFLQNRQRNNNSIQFKNLLLKHYGMFRENRKKARDNAVCDPGSGSE